MEEAARKTRRLFLSPRDCSTYDFSTLKVEGGNRRGREGLFWKRSLHSSLSLSLSLSFPPLCLLPCSKGRGEKKSLHFPWKHIESCCFVVVVVGRAVAGAAASAAVDVAGSGLVGRNVAFNFFSTAHNDKTSKNFICWNFHA